MAMNTTTEDIQQMIITMKTTINNIQQIYSNITSCAKNNEEWNDTQGQAFQRVMSEIAQSTTQPVRTLTNAIQALEKLSAAVDGYNSIKF